MRDGLEEVPIIPNHALGFVVRVVKAKEYKCSP
jgi:hypothetical protein